MPRPVKEPPPRKPNPLRNRKPVNAPLPPIYQAAAAAAAAAKAAPRPARRACPNKTCSAPDVVDGVCHNCGTIVDDSNIVSEVQFGESANGAAVVQGSFVSADQGTAKSLGPAFRRAGGMEDRESTIREGKRTQSPFLAITNYSQVDALCRHCQPSLEFPSQLSIVECKSSSLLQTTISSKADAWTWSLQSACIPLVAKRSRAGLCLLILPTRFRYVTQFICFSCPLLNHPRSTSSSLVTPSNPFTKPLHLPRMVSSQSCQRI
jgi:hypothetical protein